MSHANAIGNEYRHRIAWIQDRLEEMAGPDGKILKADAEAMIYGRYDCSPDSVRRYLRTLEGKRFLEMNDTHVTVTNRKQKP